MLRFARIAWVLVFSLLPMAAVGCTQSSVPAPSQPSTSVSQPASSTSQSTSSAAESYLSTPVRAGWVREVGRGDGLVLVFETPTELDAGRDWPARFVLFNDGGRDRTWQNAEFGVHITGFQRGGSMTIGFYRGPGMQNSPLVLRSGESTTHEVNWQRNGFQSSDATLSVWPSVRQDFSENSIIADVPTLTINVR